MLSIPFDLFRIITEKLTVIRTIEEYAIKVFKSVWIKQIILNKIDVHIPKDIIKKLYFVLNFIVKLIVRIIPLESSFSIMEARIIDPWIGDSTWSLWVHGEK